MVKIECPSCGTEFTVIGVGDAHIECPTCGAELNIEPLYQTNSLSFEDCVIETSMVMLDLEEMDDDSLVDEISDEINSGDYMKGTFKVFSEFTERGELSEDVRKMAEGVYLLAHTNYFFGEEH